SNLVSIILFNILLIKLDRLAEVTCLLRSPGLIISFINPYGQPIIFPHKTRDQKFMPNEYARFYKDKCIYFSLLIAIWSPDISYGELMQIISLASRKAF